MANHYRDPPEHMSFMAYPWSFRLVVLLIWAGAFLPLQGHAQSCITVDAGLDDTLCQGNCATLGGSIAATRHTNTYAVNSIPYNPYPFGGGNPVIVNLDDVWSPVINLPFCFEFYGTVYNQVIIGTNGLVSFDLSGANGTCPWSVTAGVPNPGLPLNCIMAPFHDINPTTPTDSGLTSINWNVYGTAPCRDFVVNWYDIALYGNSCDTIIQTSQLVLHETTYMIDIFIRDKTFCSAWNSGAAIEGIQDATGTNGITVPGCNFPTTWNAYNDGKRFRPSGLPSYTQQWLDPAGNVVSTNLIVQVCPPQTTTYTLVVTNTSCSGTVVVTDPVTVYVLPSTLAVAPIVVQPTCLNPCSGSITLNTTGGSPPVTYTWSPNVSNGPSATNLCQGTYQIIVDDGSGCSIPLTITLQPVPTFSITTAVTPTTCNGTTGAVTATVSGSGPYTYQWSNGDTTSAISNLTTGTYMLVVTDTNGCTSSTIVTIPASGLNVTSQVTQPLCAGDCNGVATITPQNGTPPYTYNWMPSGGTNATATSLCPSIYLCHVEDANGCFTNYQVVVSSPPPVIIAPASNITICAGQSTSITAVASGGTAPYTYYWNNSLPNSPTNTITPNQTTVYSVYVEDANGCTSATQNTLVKINPVPAADFTASTADCPPSTVYFTNTSDSAIAYLWNFGDPNSGTADTSTAVSPSHNYTTGGNYVVTLIATNNYGCTDTIVLPGGLPVPVPPTAGLNAGNTVMTTLDPSATFYNTSSGATTYIIYFGDGDSLLTTTPGPYQHSYDSTGTYTVTMIAWSAQGCADTTILSLLIEEASTCYIPNAFTPTNDGLNDLFMVYGVNIAEFDLLIFDRWGMLLYESHDQSTGWDGTYKGHKCQEDVYVWRLRYLDNSGNRHDRIGHVSLIR